MTLTTMMPIINYRPNDINPLNNSGFTSLP